MPPKKKQAQPAQPSRMRTRTMGYSPGGPKSLDTEAPVPKPVPPPRVPQKETRRSRKDPGLLPKVKKSAATDDDADIATSSTIATEATSSENAVAPTLETSPHPTTTSRSQSPHLETESDSLQVPESPSTTPPPRQTRSKTRSISPNAAEQQHNQQQPKPKKAAARPSTRLGKNKNKRKATGLDEELENNEGKDNDTPATEERVAKRSRRDEPRSVQGESAPIFKNKNKRKAAELDEELENDERKDSNNFQEPSAKRSRRDEQRPVHNESTSTFTDSAPAAVEDSSADDVAAELERPPRPSRNRSRSASRQPVPTTTVNPEDASAEESSSDNQQPEASRQLSLTLFEPSGKPLTPKPVPSTSPSRELITDDIVERNQMYKMITGRDMPVPRNQIGLPKYGRASYREEDGDGDEIDMDAIAERMTPSRTRDEMLMNRIVLLQEKLRKERTEAEKAQKSKGANAASSGPSEKHFRYHKIVVPADASSGEYILTGRRVIGPIRAFCRYAEHNPFHRLPNDAQMEQFLSEFNAQESVQPDSLVTSSRSNDYSTITSPEASTSQHPQHRLVGSRQPLDLESEGQNVHRLVGSRQPLDLVSEAQDIHGTVGSQQPLNLESEAPDGTMVNVLVAEEAATQDQTSEVHTEVEEPQTPTPQQSHGWLSSVSSFLTTPIKYFGRRSQSAEAVNTNGDAVVGGSSNEPLIPQTSDFAIPPTTPINRRNGRKLITQSERRPVSQTSDFAIPPITPTNRRDGRKLMPQTERRPGILLQGPKTGSKTERHVRFQSPEERAPLHMRGMLSEEQKLEIWRQQDEDLHLKKRQDRRAKTHARVEDEDEHAANPYVESARAGEKRKHYHPDVPPEAWNYEGTFSVPDSPSSSEEDEEGDSQDDFERRFIGTSVRKNRYDGTLFAQPPDVQANIDEGMYPLTPRNGIPPKELALLDKFFGQPAKQTPEVSTTNIFGNLSKQAPEVTTTPATSAGSANGGRTFSAPAYDENDEEETTAGMERGTEENAAGDASVLQPKTWTQTPPPKPKPSNAQLPQVSAPATPAELAKARYEKFKPVRPSGLRNMSVMSPLAQPEAPTEASAQHPWISDLSEEGFHPDVLKELWKIPDENMIETRLPAHLYEERVVFQPEVEAAVIRTLG